MLGPIRVVVPTPGGAEVGHLHPVPDARSGVVLMDGAGPAAPLTDGLYAELGYYLQAAGIPSIRLRRPRRAGLAARLCHLVGAGSLLRSLGIERVVLAVVTEEAWSQEAATGRAFSASLDLLRQRTHSPRDLARVTAELTAMIRDTADTVVGVVTLSQAAERGTTGWAGARGQVVPKQPLAIATTGASATFALGVAPIARLALDLPDVPRLPGAPVAPPTDLIARVYLWCTSVLAHGQRLSGSRCPARAVPEASPAELAECDLRVAYRRRLDWLAAQWQELLSMLATRAPDRADRVRALADARHAEAPDPLRSARYAWPFMDAQARRDWLRICSQMFSREGSA